MRFLSPVNFQLHVNDDADGTYNVSYSLVEAGMFTFVISLLGNSVGGRDFLLTVLPSEVDPSRTIATGTALFPTEAGKEVVLNLEFHDEYSNKIGADSVKVSLSAIYSGIDNVSPQIAFSSSYGLV